MKQLLFAFALVAAACSQPPGGTPDPDPDPDPDPPVERSASIQFAPGLQAAAANQFSDEFSLLAQRDIVAVIELPGQTGTHFYRFDIVNEAGAVQQSSYKAYSTDSSAPSELMHPVLDQMVSVEKVSLDTDGYIGLQGFIPVAGTSFTRYRLTGTFRAQILLGTEESPEVTLEDSFEMLP